MPLIRVASQATRFFEILDISNKKLIEGFF